MRLQKGDQDLVRRQNRAIIINLLRLNGPLSRTDIADRAGLAPSCLTRLVRELLIEGVVVEVGKSDSSGGRPAVLFRGLVVKQALEIGTSTGHSGIWTAWALSKTGGKLITIDIDEGRHREAVANFKEAGVDRFIDARLADAHDLVPKLAGPFDFVFIDADKNWTLNYFKALLPKLASGGCFAELSPRSKAFRRRWTKDP